MGKAPGVMGGEGVRRGSLVRIGDLLWRKVEIEAETVRMKVLFFRPGLPMETSSLYPERTDILLLTSV